MPRADAHSARLKYDESPSQIVSPSVYKIGRLFGYSRSGASRETQKHDTGRLEPAGMNQLAKVLVFGEENTLFLKSKADHRLVISPRRYVGDGQHFMSQSSQRADNRVVTTLVGEKPHHR